jgi:hypothetical protein
MNGSAKRPKNGSINRVYKDKLSSDEDESWSFVFLETPEQGEDDDYNGERRVSGKDFEMDLYMIKAMQQLNDSD